MWWDVKSSRAAWAEGSTKTDITASICAVLQQHEGVAADGNWAGSIWQSRLCR
jgi:hypothetical protein